SSTAWDHDSAARGSVRVDAIAAGRTHGLALKNGKVIAWGSDSYGESEAPQEALSGVDAIAAGWWHSLALKDGKVIAWGERGAGSSRPFRLHATLNNPATRTAKVTWHTKDHTATAGQDYVANGGTVRFLPGETDKVITVKVLGDNTIEPPESFVVKLDYADG